MDGVNNSTLCTHSAWVESMLPTLGAVGAGIFGGTMCRLFTNPTSSPKRLLARGVMLAVGATCILESFILSSILEQECDIDTGGSSSTDEQALSLYLRDKVV